MEVRVDLSDFTVETERLYLRPWQETDLVDFNAYASVPGVGEMAGWPHHTSMEESKSILRIIIEGKSTFAIVHKADEKAIGTIDLHPSWANNDNRFRHLKLLEIGYVLSKEYWGQGLMPEAVKALIELSFMELGFEALTCGHFEENYQSRRVIEKCGFTFLENGVFDAKQLGRIFNGRRYIIIKR